MVKFADYYANGFVFSIFWGVAGLWLFEKYGNYGTAEELYFVSNEITSLLTPEILSLCVCLFALVFLLREYFSITILWSIGLGKKLQNLLIWLQCRKSYRVYTPSEI